MQQRISKTNQNLELSINVETDKKGGKMTNSTIYIIKSHIIYTVIAISIVSCIVYLPNGFVSFSQDVTETTNSLSSVKKNPENLLGLSKEEAYPVKYISKDKLEKASGIIRSCVNTSIPIDLTLLRIMLREAKIVTLDSKSLKHSFVYGYNKKIWENSLITVKEDPCHNFFAYACGDALMRTIKYTHKEKVSKFYKRTIFNEKTELDVLGYDMFKKMFQQCNATNSLDIQNVTKIFKQIIDFKWHVEPEWDVHSWDIKHAIKRLILEHKLPFLKSEIIIDGNITTPRENKYIIQLQPNTDEIAKSIERYKRYLDNRTYLKKIMSLVNGTFHRHIFNKYHNELLSWKKKDEHKFIDILFDIEEMNAITNHIDWKHYALFRIPDANYKNIKFSLGYARNTFYDLRNLIYEHDFGNDYIVFLLIEDYQYALPKSYRMETSDEENEKNCADWIIQKLPLVYTSSIKKIIENSTDPLFMTNSWNRILKLTKRIKSNFISKLNDNSGAIRTRISRIAQSRNVSGHFTIKHFFNEVKSKVRKLKLEDTFHTKSHSYNSIIMYKVAHYLNKSFISNIVHLNQFTSRNINDLSSYMAEIDLEYDDYESLYKTNKHLNFNNYNGYFKRYDNVILMDQILFGFPGYEPQYKIKYMDYASMGFKIAREIAYFLTDKGLKKINNEIKNEEYTKSMKEVVDQSIYKEFMYYRTCMFRDNQFKRYWDGRVSNKENVTQTMNSRIANAIGLDVAFEVYKKHEKEYPSKKLYGHTDKSDDQHFFFTFAQEFCDGKQYYEKDSAELPAFARMKSILVNNGYFHRAFKCKRYRDEMNKIYQCRHIWQ